MSKSLKIGLASATSSSFKVRVALKQIKHTQNTLAIVE